MTYEMGTKTSRIPRSNVHSFRGTRFAQRMADNGMLPANDREIAVERLEREEMEFLMAGSELEFDKYTKIPCIVQFDTDIHLTTRSVYAGLLSYMWFDDEAFPRISTLAKRMGTSVSTISKHLNALIDIGLIVKFVKHGKAIYQLVPKPSRYYLSNGILNDESLERLRKAGFEKAVCQILKRREEIDSLFAEEEIDSGDEGDSSDSLSCDDVTGEIDKKEEVSDEDVGPAMVNERFEGVIGVIKKRDSERQILQERKQKRVASKEAIAKSRPSTVDSAEKNKQIRREERKQQRKKETGSELTVKDVKEAWDISCLHKFPGVDSLCSPWDLKQVKLAKHICDKYKIQRVIEVIPRLIADWEIYANRFRIKGYPSIEVICFKASQLFPEVEGGSCGYVEPVRSKYKAFDCTGDDVKAAWKKMFKVAFGREYEDGRWGDKEKNCSRSIARKVSKAGVEKIIIDLMVNWDKYCHRFGFKRTPGIGLLSTHMGMMQNLLDTGKLFMDQEGNEAEIRERIKGKVERKEEKQVVEKPKKLLF